MKIYKAIENIKKGDTLEINDGNVKKKQQDIEWVDINTKVIPAKLFKKYGISDFQIMKQKMRKDGEIWNNINFFDAKKEAEKLGYRLPDMREMLALLEFYKQKNKTISENDKEFLGIEELSYEEKVCYEWIEGAGCAFRRGGYWSGGSNAGAFSLHLSISPGPAHYCFGFRCVR